MPKSKKSECCETSWQEPKPGTKKKRNRSRTSDRYYLFIKKINDLEGALISNEDMITAKESELQSLVTKVKENERILEAYSKKVMDGAFEVTEENSSALFELIRRLTQSVELLNVEMRTKNQTRIAILQKRVDMGNTA